MQQLEPSIRLVKNTEQVRNTLVKTRKLTILIALNNNLASGFANHISETDSQHTHYKKIIKSAKYITK